MKRIIHYSQIIPQYNEQHEQTGEEKIYLSVENNNDKDYNEQLETIKGYCNDWTIETFVREEKYAEFDVKCNENIISGIDVKTSQGNKHFTFKEYFYDNLRDAIDAINAVENGKLPVSIIENGIPFKADDGQCLYYTIEDISIIDLYKKAQILRERTYLSALLAWCDTLSDEEVDKVNYGDDLPKQYQSHVDTVMLPFYKLIENN